MEEQPDWRSESYAKAFDDYDRADFAQEFLRRNPEYRDQYAEAIDAAPIVLSRLARRWGLLFVADPDLPAHYLPIVWHPSAAASIILLRPAPFPCDGCSSAEIIGNLNVVADRRDGDGRHLILSTGQRRFRLNICGEATEAEPLAYVLAGDAFWETRQAAVSAFHETFYLGHLKKLPICLAPGASEHWRLVQWLRLLDALSGGASARELAIELISRDVGRYSAAEWDASSERKRIARWQRQAIAMRNGGYLTLLNGP